MCVYPQNKRPHPQANLYKLSDLISRMIVQLDTNVFPGLSSTIEVIPSPSIFDPEQTSFLLVVSFIFVQWRKSQAPSVVNGFEIKRLGKMLLFWMLVCAVLKH
jgi:hypothetical protein